MSFYVTEFHLDVEGFAKAFIEKVGLEEELEGWKERWHRGVWNIEAAGKKRLFCCREEMPALPGEKKVEEQRSQAGIKQDVTGRKTAGQNNSMPIICSSRQAL